MSNRDALRKLIKRFPTPPEVKDIFTSLSKDSDRSVAIVSASILENILEQLIIHKFKNSDSVLLGQIFNNRGPLSDFHGKILIATAFGIINPPMAEEIKRIKNIRNVFAHAPTEINFNTKEISEEMGNSYIIQIVEEKVVMGLKDANIATDKPVSMRSKSGFIMVAEIICTVLDGEISDIGGTPMMTHRDASLTSPEKSPPPHPFRSNKARVRIRPTSKRPPQSSQE